MRKKTTPQNVKEANEGLFHATMNLPAAARHCGMTNKEMKLTFGNTLNIMTQTLKSLKTPLRYPRGKSRAVSKLFQYLPDLSRGKEYREPFIGGGSVAIEIGKRYPKMNIWVNDLYEPLYNFWCELRDNGREMRDQLVQLKYRYCEPASARILFQQARGK